MHQLAVILLAAGQGTRMNSKTQKILHQVGGKPMVVHPFNAVQKITDYPPVLVIGKGGEKVEALFGTNARYITQTEQLGTGDATRVCRSLLQGKTKQILVTYGDMPLLRSETMAQLAEKQAETEATIIMLSAWGTADSTFGRVIRHNGRIKEIMEVAQAHRQPNAQELLAIQEQNAGVYCFDADWLWNNIDQLPLRQARSGPEYYLTDMIELAVQQGLIVDSIIGEDPDEWLGAGTRSELVTVEKAFRRRANNRWLNAGVTLIDPDSTFIDQDVQIGQDTTIWPNSFIQGDCVIGTDCQIGPNSIIRNSKIGHHSIVEQSVIEDSTLAPNTVLSPFTHLK